MLAALAAFALLTSHILPGLLVVHFLGIGRSYFERWVMASVFGGPLSAALYLLSLTAGLRSLYWVCLAVLDAAAIITVFLRSRPPSSDARGPSRSLTLGLTVLIGLVVAAYLLTTGSLFRVGAGGDLLLDRALQRDTFFHIGVVRSVLSSYPPELLSASGVKVAYHAGYHLQVAAWARYFGIDVLDGLYRVGAVWSLGLLVLSAFLLGRRFTRSEAGGLTAAVLIFGSGLGFLFSSAPNAEWWSLVFVDVTLVSVFLPNPLLPALPLLFAGLACLEDYLEGGDRGNLLGSGFGLVPLFFIKVFLGAQILTGVALAALLMGRKRLRQAAVFLCLASLLVVSPMLMTGSGNTAVGVRPLEIVRYSMEKLGWLGAVHGLTDPGSNLGVATGATLVWIVGFLGIRLVGLRAVLRDMSGPGINVRTPMAHATWIGLLLALVFRVAPAEATGFSRLEAFNDVVWFAAQSGTLLWFWVAEALVVFARRGAAWWFVSGACIVLALPCSVQHFVHKASLEADRVPAELVEAAEKVRELSSPGEVWVEPLNRVRPSLVAYLAGRPVVHDSYVGYDYMFLSREEIDYRRHAVAQFWRTDDAGYVRWFFDRYAVRGIFAMADTPLPRASRDRVDLVFSNRVAHLYVVGHKTLDAAVISTPARLPLGLRGAPYFGRGWSRPSGSPRTRKLLPGIAELYVPRRADVPLTLRLELETPHATGTIYFGGERFELRSESETVRLTGPTARESGLHRLVIEWDGSQSLVVKRIETITD